MKLFSTGEIKTNCVVRAIGDIRRGLPIIINGEYLIASVETLSESHFNKLKQYFKDKLIFVVHQNGGQLVLNASQICFKESKALNYTVQNTSDNDPYKIYFSVEEEKIIQLAKKFLKQAKLCPVFLFARLNEKDKSFLGEKYILNLDKSEFDFYEKFVKSNVEQITESVSIKLKQSSNATVTMFRVINTGEEHCAITIGDIGRNTEPLVRIHSACYTGDLLKSLQCDCHNQLHLAIQDMNKNPGVIIYLAQEGRGIGLANKLRAYELQRQGYDTVEANEKLGFDMDERDYSIAAEILKKLKITKAKLLTNNPQKKVALVQNGITISEVLPLMTEINIYNEKYISTKRKKMAHTI